MMTFAERINEAAAAIGDPDRCELDGDSFRIVREASLAPSEEIEAARAEAPMQELEQVKADNETLWLMLARLTGAVEEQQYTLGSLGWQIDQVNPDNQKMKWSRAGAVWHQFQKVDGAVLDARLVLDNKRPASLELGRMRAELGAVQAERDQLRAEVRRLAIESEYLVQRGNAAQQEVERLRGALETALRQWRGYYCDQHSEDIERQKHPEAELYLYCAALTQPSEPASDTRQRVAELEAELKAKQE